MYSKISFLFFFLMVSFSSFSQEKIKIDYFSTARSYEIADINVIGEEDYDKSIIIGFSKLKVGDKIEIPGDEISAAIKRFWKEGLFSDVKIVADSLVGDKVYLGIHLQRRSKVSEIRYDGVKKSDIEEFETIVTLKKGSQITPNLVNEAKTIVSNYFHDKGYSNVEVLVTEQPDLSEKNSVIVLVDVKKNNKVKVHKIFIEGNNNLSAKKINKAMKKTNEGTNIWNIFSAKKFVRELYEADKLAVIEKYNEVGYRDAYIEKDTVKSLVDYKIRTRKNTSALDSSSSLYVYDTLSVKSNPKKVNVYLTINEGKKYYFRDIKWIGNTIYSSDVLNQFLRINKGDIYNSTRLNERLLVDEDAVANLYQDNGYLFFNVDPVETNIDGDSIDFEMRVYEGKQATINKVGIEGNTTVYEHVVRREIRTKPGQLYNKSDIIRTVRELAQMGQFDPENIVPDIQPDPENGTVDINYILESKSSDQVELSAGYGYTGVTGSLGLTFKNFAIENLFNPKSYRIVPQGEGQTLSLKGQTNGSYYSSFSASLTDPWFGNKRPNSLTVAFNYSSQSGVSSSYSDTYSSYSSLYSSDYSSYTTTEVDPDKYIHTTGISIGLGKRLQWPDDYFVLNAQINYQNYALKNWSYFIMTDGTSNNLNLALTLGRSSIDNPLYTRKGSAFSLSAKVTPPYSLFSGNDYADAADAVKYEWLEFHKWKFNGKVFTPLSSDQKLVLMSRAEYGFLGYYNENRRSPFETFVVGGDGMSSYSTYATDIIGLRGYTSGSLTPSTSGYNGNVYTRLTMEVHYPVVLEPSTTIYVLGFLEGGNCWSDFSEFNPFSLKRSAGIGVRMYLPMLGMMGVDWGYGFDLVNGSSTYGGSQFAFMIGQEF